MNFCISCGKSELTILAKSEDGYLAKFCHECGLELSFYPDGHFRMANGKERLGESMENGCLAIGQEEEVEHEKIVLPVYHGNMTEEEKLKSRAWMRKQLQPIVTAPLQYMMTCFCGKRVVFWMTYRCLYCGVFFCKACAEEHFGARVPTLNKSEQVE